MIRPAILLGATFATALSFGFVACSLGEGVTPECDPNASPTDADACFEVATCDTGNGIVTAEQGCCVEAGGSEYGGCAGMDINGDFRDLCEPGGADEGSKCCDEATSTFDLCMLGRLSGSAGVGGAGGAGGTSGGTGGAGANGGMSMGGMAGMAGTAGGGG